MRADCDLDREHDGFLTEYVATRWYRAPEVLLSRKNYGFAVDMFSVGCILAEMFNGHVFLRGMTHLDQLDVIFRMVGSPSPQEIDAINSASVRDYVRSRPVYAPQDLSVAVPSAPADALDLLAKMLTRDPAQRISVDDALAHPFLDDFRDPEDEVCFLDYNHE